LEKLGGAPNKIKRPNVKKRSAATKKKGSCTKKNLVHIFAKKMWGGVRSKNVIPFKNKRNSVFSKNIVNKWCAYQKRTILIQRNNVDQETDPVDPGSILVPEKIISV
jgi:hypothetical protein